MFIYTEQLNICDEHSVVLSCNPQSLICPLHTNTRIGGCNSMTKQTASCTIIKYQDNHPRKHEHSFACSLIYLSLVVNDETRFILWTL